MVATWLVVLGCFGVNFAVWGMVGLVRLADATGDRLRRLPRQAGSRSHRALRSANLALCDAARGALLPVELDPGRTLGGRGATSRPITMADVAVLMAAHNEEIVIDDSLAAITTLVPAANVHVVSDFSTDATVELALRRGVKVVQTPTNVGKAGALEFGIEQFGLVERFRAVLLLDADTRLDPDYFNQALPLFDDPDVVAVAGCAHSQWQRSDVTWRGRALIAHRSRIYGLTQRLLKFGQTWRHVNATHIVPGFASLYRTSVLPEITINPRGLVIEDFNMTFEVYRKRLGRIAFCLGAKAVTQDPDTFGDYIRQTKRWALGLWQTVRRHGVRPDLLSAMVFLLLLELLTASVMFLALPLVALALVLPDLVPSVLQVPAVAAAHQPLAEHLDLSTLAVGVLAPDYALTCALAAAERQPRYLLYGVLFVPLRVLDAGIALYSLPRAWLERSTGQWKSPARRIPVTDSVIDLRDAKTPARGMAPIIGPVVGCEEEDRTDVAG